MKGVCIVFLSTMLCGCTSVVVTPDGENSLEKVQNCIGGRYRIEAIEDGGTGLELKDFLKDEFGRGLFAADGDDVVPLSVHLTRKNDYLRKVWRGCDVANLFLGMFTLMAWPVSEHALADYEVTVVSPMGKDVLPFSIAKNEYNSWTPLVFAPMLWGGESVLQPLKDRSVGADEESERMIAKVANSVAVEVVEAALLKQKYDLFFAEKWKEREKLAKDKAKVELRKKAAEMKRQGERESIRRMEEERVADEKRRVREGRIQAFALTEAPEVWHTIQYLRGEIASLDAGLVKLRKELIDFNRKPDEDADYVKLNEVKNGMSSSIEVLMAKLREAYIAAKKFEATPSRKDYDEIRRKAIDDGLREADSAAGKYRDMLKSK